ncbi:MAG: hypothetical protein HC875_33425 [Anaerolineales bacterium]|nr:hypothetical protein [Anaerolineales bacterium]
MKMKHNKKKNTAFLYEACLRFLALSIQEKNNKVVKDLTSLLKETFSYKTFLGQELKLYQDIYIPQTKNTKVIEKIIQENKKTFFSIPQDKLNEERSNFLNKISQISPEIMNSFVPTYKMLATINQIFSPFLSPADKIILEEGLTKEIENSKENKPKFKLEHLDNLAYKLFIKKFNEEYSPSLLKEQKELVSKYILSINGDNLTLKIFINEEVGRIKKVLDVYKKNKDVLLVEKINELESSIKDFSNSISLEKEQLIKLLKIQELVSFITKEE